MFIDIEKWREIFNTLSRHKLRTSLTAFGVFWGIFMLTVLLGSGKGLENGVNEGFPRVTNFIYIWAQGTTQVPYEGMPIGREILLSQTMWRPSRRTWRASGFSRARTPWVSGAAVRRSPCTIEERHLQHAGGSPGIENINTCKSWKAVRSTR